MGIASYEAGEYGKAVGFLEVASASLTGVWIPNQGSILGRYRNEIEDAKLDIEHMKRTYQNENNNIHYKKVPTEVELEIFEAKNITKPEPWTPPQPKYSKLY